MIVSWNWLKQYVPLDMPAEEFDRAADDGRAEPRVDRSRSATTWPSTWR